MTAGEVKLVDLAVVLAGMVLCALASGEWPDATVPATRYLLALAVLGTCLGLGVSTARLRVLRIGPGMFYEPVLLSQPFSDEFFRGLRTGPRLHAVQAEVAQALRSRPESIYFGPRMQWAYAAFAQRSPAGQPLWWHPGVAFPAAAQDGYVTDLLRGRFELMVFLKADYTYLPPDFAARLSQRYDRVPGFSEIDLYRRRSVR